MGEVSVGSYYLSLWSQSAQAHFAASRPSRREFSRRPGVGLAECIFILAVVVWLTANSLPVIALARAVTIQPRP